MQASSSAFKPPSQVRCEMYAATLASIIGWDAYSCEVSSGLSWLLAEHASGATTDVWCADKARSATGEEAAASATCIVSSLMSDATCMAGG